MRFIVSLNCSVKLSSILPFRNHLTVVSMHIVPSTFCDVYRQSENHNHNNKNTKQQQQLQQQSSNNWENRTAFEGSFTSYKDGFWFITPNYNSSLPLPTSSTRIWANRKEIIEWCLQSFWYFSVSIWCQWTFKYWPFSTVVFFLSRPSYVFSVLILCRWTFEHWTYAI